MSRLNEEKMIAALLKHSSQKAAAEELGISDRTIRKYLAKPSFMARLNEQKRLILAKATDQIQAAMQPSIAALREIAEDPKAGKAARVQAARALLEYGIKLGEYSDLNARITALEQTDTAADLTEEL